MKKFIKDLKFFIIIIVLAGLSSVFSYFYSKQTSPVYKNSVKILISAQNIKLNNQGKIISLENMPARKILGLIRAFGNFSNDKDFILRVADKLNINNSNKELESLASNIIVYLDRGSWNLNVDVFSDSKTKAYNIADAAGSVATDIIQSNLGKIQPGEEAIVYKASITSPANINETYRIKPRPLKTSAATFLLIIFIASCFKFLKNVFMAEKNIV